METTRTHVERLSSLTALARMLRKGMAMNHCDGRDQMLLAEMLEHTAQPYETEAHAERERMSIVMLDAQEAESNAARRRKGMGESLSHARTRMKVDSGVTASAWHGAYCTNWRIALQLISTIACRWGRHGPRNIH